jgi:hypothetical protein
VPYLRFTRDRRGYENTFLLHASYPGECPRVLYWYRTAPEVRIGRPALDPDAIREIEAAHPEILFDWPEILEVGATAQPEVEPPRPPRKRKGRPREDAPARRPPHPPEGHAEPATGVGLEGDLEETTDPPTLEPSSHAEAVVASEVAAVFVHTDQVPPRPTAGLLEELVGRGIATRLRGRYAELAARVADHPADDVTKERWRLRLDALNPDAWVTAEDILHGMSRADALYDQLRREVVSGDGER